MVCSVSAAILDLSKIEAGRMTIENAKFNLDTLIDNLRNLFEERTHSKLLDFDIEVAEGTPRHLVGDAMRIQQILSNLLGNAIKFTEKGRIALKVDVKAVENSHALISFTVEDSGIGISQEDLAKLFQPFTQADGSITRKFGGTGLGLAISQKLLNLMGGKFNVTSQPSHGSNFSFDLLLGVAIQTNIRDVRLRVKPEAGVVNFRR